jgi:hypothetical protein
MFKDSGQSYWDTLRGRAWILTRDLFGWNVGTGVITGICFVAGLVRHAANRGRQEALDNLTLTLIYAASFAVAAPLGFAFNTIRAARMVHEEQQEEIERHEDAPRRLQSKSGTRGCPDRTAARGRGPEE